VQRLPLCFSPPLPARASFDDNEKARRRNANRTLSPNYIERRCAGRCQPPLGNSERQVSPFKNCLRITKYA